MKTGNLTREDSAGEILDQDGAAPWTVLFGGVLEVISIDHSEGLLLAASPVGALESD